MQTTQIDFDSSPAGRVTLKAAERQFYRDLPGKPILTIERAYTDRLGRDVQTGWHVFMNGQWCQKYGLLRDAKSAVRQMEADYAEATGGAA
jgi:hypothetical protein